MKTVAAFDLDNTITDRDCLLRFVLFMNGSLKTAWDVLKIIPYLVLFFLGFKSRQEVKEKFLSFTLPGKDIKIWGDKFAKKIAPSFLIPSALERIKWHKNQGHELVLISANLDCFVSPLGSELHFDKIICTKLVYPPTGKIAGLNCYGEEKVKRLIEELGPKENYILYAYGDSNGDKELLNLADYPYFRHFEK